MSYQSWYWICSSCAVESISFGVFSSMWTCYLSRLGTSRSNYLVKLPLRHADNCPRSQSVSTVTISVSQLKSIPFSEGAHESLSFQLLDRDASRTAISFSSSSERTWLHCSISLWLCRFFENLVHPDHRLHLSMTLVCVVDLSGPSRAVQMKFEKCSLTLASPFRRIFHLLLLDTRFSHEFLNQLRQYLKPCSIQYRRQRGPDDIDYWHPTHQVSIITYHYYVDPQYNASTCIVLAPCLVSMISVWLPMTSIHVTTCSNTMVLLHQSWTP